MSKRQAEIVLHYIHHLAAGSASGPEHDRQLLELFALRHEESAFATLLDRHGAMVLRVCRCILHDTHEAEDAFQATFLILARKAGAIRHYHSVASWLYKVAYRVALRARAAASRREELAARAPRRQVVDPLAEVSGRELLSVLDDELQRLPEKYRAPLVLCYLEGHTQDEAARQLGWTPHVLRGRIERGRSALRKRLIRRGFGLSVALAGSLFEQVQSSAAVPAVLTANTLRAAVRPSLDAAAVSPQVAALVETGINALGASKLKLIVSMVLMLGILATGLGAGLSSLRVPQSQTPPPVPAPAPPPAQAKDAPRGDRYGDPLPPGAVARLGTIRFRQGDSVYGLTFSPDGKTIASCNYWGHEDRAIYLWDVSSGQLLRQFHGHSHSVLCLAFSPDGKTLASASRDKTIRLWEVATGKEVRRIDTPGGDHHFLAFSPDGRRLATTCSISDVQRIALWDTATGQEILRLQGHEKFALSLAFAPDGNSLASSSQGPSLTLWDLASGKEVRRLEIGAAPVYRRPVAFTPDGKQLIAGHADNTLRLWDIATGTEVRTFRGHKKATVRLAFSADGKTLTSASEDRTVRFWDVASGNERRAVSIGLVSSFMFDSVTFSPGEKLLAVAGVNNAIRLFDTADGKELRPAGHQAPISALAFSPDGKAVTSISWDRTFRRWDATTGRELRRGGGLEATLLSCPLLPSAKEYYAVSFLVHSACLSSDGHLLATGEGHSDARIHLWDAASGKEIRSFASNTGSVIALAFSPDEHVLASASWDNTVRLWDVATGKQLRRFSGHEGGTSPGHDSLYSVCFSADGKWLASSGGDRTVRVWEVATGRQLHCLRHETCVFTTAFSRDGRMLATAESQHANEPPGYTGIVLWEMASGKERRRLDGREWVVGALAFSPDGRSLASGSANGTVRVWDPLAGTERGRFVGHRGLVKSLAFSDDGRRLVSGGSDTTALVWDTGWLRPAEGRREKPQKEIGEKIWQDLAGADAACAYQAMAQLVVSSDAVGLLKKRLRPTAPVEGEKITRWINDLDSDTFATREQASAELAKRGDRAEHALRRTLGKSPSLEARRRIEALLDKLSSPAPQLLFALRAVEMLEHIGSPQAREILQVLAAGDPDARLTRDAKASLRRLDLAGPSPNRDR